MSAMQIVGASIVAAALGAVVGYQLGTAAIVAPVSSAAPSPGDPELATALREFAERLAAVERAVAERAPTVRQAAVPAEGDPATPAETDALLQKLGEITRDLAVLRAEREHEELRRAREQNPQTHEAAVRALQAALTAESELPQPQRATRRDWMLRTMADVVTRLGMPTSVIAGGDSGPMWEYCIGDDVLGITFRDGLVVDIWD